MGTRDRRGTTLVELIVATSLLGVLVAILAASGLRAQRVHDRLRRAIDARRPLRDGALVLSAELGTLASAAGDLDRGAGADTALAVRTVVAHGLLCDAQQMLVLAFGDEGATRAPEPADTLWLLDAGRRRWLPRRVLTVSATTEPCAALADRPSGGARWRIGVESDTPALQRGAPARITRRARFSLYRGEGGWQLGYREWSATVGAVGGLQGIQPASGPYAAAGVRFRYFAADGAELGSPGDGRGVARVEVELRGAVEPPAARTRADTPRLAVAVGGPR